MNQPLKTMKVEMLVHVYGNGDCIKKWEHHIDYAIDMDSYPEINGISDVKVNDITDMMIECTSINCAYNHNGICKYHAVFNKQPTITKTDGCTDGIIKLK